MKKGQGFMVRFFNLSWFTCSSFLHLLHRICVDDMLVGGCACEEHSIQYWLRYSLWHPFYICTCGDHPFVHPNEKGTASFRQVMYLSIISNPLCRRSRKGWSLLSLQCHNPSVSNLLCPWCRSDTGLLLRGVGVNCTQSAFLIISFQSEMLVVLNKNSHR